jgi:hypothetical protein
VRFFFSIEVTLDQILRKWHHFIKPFRRIKNLLTVKPLLNAVYYFIVFLSGLCKPLFCEKEALGMSSWNQGSGGPKHFLKL